MSLGGDHIWAQSNSDPRLEFEGVFATSESAAMGTTAPQRDASFTARSDAMATAYYFGKHMAQFAQQTVADTAEIAANADTMLDDQGKIYGLATDGRLFGSWDAIVAADAHGTHTIASNMLSMEVMGASLANLFSFDSATVTNAAYAGEFNGFSITHGRLGKIMDVAADGAITLYDSSGTAYSAAGYSAANVDGGIPQLRKDIIRRSDKH